MSDDNYNPTGIDKAAVARIDIDRHMTGEAKIVLVLPSGEPRFFFTQAGAQAWLANERAEGFITDRVTLHSAAEYLKTKTPPITSGADCGQD